MKATGKIIGGLVLAAMLLTVRTGFTQTTVTLQNSLTGITLAPGTPVQSAAPDSIVQVTAEAQGLQLVTPDQALFHSGSFCYWWVLPDGGFVPMPCLPQDYSSVPVYQIVPNVFLVDESGGKVSVSTRHSGNPVTSAMIQNALETEATAVVNLIAQVQTAALNPPAIPATRTGGGMMMMASSLASSYAYANGAYLNNLVATIAADGSTTMNFNIVGGTNFVPYDILMTTNVATPAPSWSWLGIGYTSNRYTFAGQPADMGFYILAKPSKTMVVGWGQDADYQTDIPVGITNAVMVAGGYSQGLALLMEGTIRSWGDDDYTSQPTTLTGVAMIACGWNHNVALLTNGFVTAWGNNIWGELNIPAGLSNVTVISAQALHSLALRNDGTVVGWGDNSLGQNNVPSALTNVSAIAAGGEHSLAVSNGFVVAWGASGSGQCTVPAGLSNVWDVAAGWDHSVALKKDGTVVCWGSETSVPAGLSNVVAIAAGGDPFDGTAYTLALRRDGTVVAWGDSEVLDPLIGMTNVIAIGGGNDYGLAIRTGPRTPVITLQPVDQYQVVGSNATFTAKGQGLYGVTYQWQTNGVNLAGATAATLTLTNLQLAQAGPYNAVITDNGGMGSLVSSNANLYLVTPPVITSQSQPTNIVCIYGNNVAFSVLATAPGQTNGFPLSYQWQFNGTNISAPNSNSYSFFADDNSSGNYSVTVANGAGSASASWQVTVTNTINVTNDLLLIYNTNSVDSATVLNYYLAHRPGVSGANVLGIGCTTNETFLLDEYTNVFAAQVKTWLTNNPMKRPQYLILFPDIPSRVSTNNTPGVYDYNLPGDPRWPSVQYRIRYGCLADWNPLVTSINLGSTNDSVAYINKLEFFGTNYAPGQLTISASASNYGNTNFILDDVRHGPGSSEDLTSGYNSVIPPAIPAITNANSGVTATYLGGLETSNSLFLPHITNAVNVAGYICWGWHSNWGTTNYSDGNYSLDGNVKWSGNSGWWVIRTVESFNGQRSFGGQGQFLQWFSSNAFGGTNYSNTPVGGPSYTDEPGAKGTDNAIYFGSWAAGKNLAICAWISCGAQYYQVVGDPFVTR